jgi:hypothetical protein
MLFYVMLCYVRSGQFKVRVISVKHFALTGLDLLIPCVIDSYALASRLRRSTSRHMLWSTSRSTSTPASV